MAKKRTIGTICLLLGTISAAAIATTVGLHFTINKNKTNKLTYVNKSIQAQEFGWSQIDVEQAKDQVNNQFIFDNKPKFLNGDYEINDANQITNVVTSIENNNLKVSFTLIANTWYDAQGNLGTNNKEFSTTIEGFVQPKQPTQIINSIDAISLNLNNLIAQEAYDQGLINNQFVYTNLSKFFNGHNNVLNVNDIVSVNAQVSNNTLNVAITLKANTWYDQNGNLGKTEQTFNTVINNFKEPIIKNETTINNPIQAQEFGWSQIEVGQAKDQINNQFIFDNKTKFLNGDYEINDANQITSVTTSIENNNLKVSFTLSANTWYDNQGNLGTNDKEFSTTIEGFKQKQPTQIINPVSANALGLESHSAQEARTLIDTQFIFNNKTKFFSGDNNILDKDNIIDLKIQVLDNKLNVSFKLKSNSWYDQNGDLGTSDREFATVIDGFTLKATTLAISNLDVSQMELKANDKNATPGTLGNSLLPSEIISAVGDKTTNWPNDTTSWYILDFVYQSISELDGTPNIFSNLITIPTYNADWRWNDFNAIFESYRVISEGNEDATGKLKIELILTNKYGTSATQGEKPKFVLTISGLKIKPQETQINNPISASTLSLESNSAQEARTLIDTQFIFENKNKFFSGNNNISNKDNIIDLKIQVSNNTLSISFKLKSNSWYDDKESLGTTDKEFSTIIEKFTLKPTELVIKDLDVSNMAVKASNAKGTLGNTILPSEIIAGAGDKITNWPNDNKAWYVLDYIYQSISELDGTPNIFNNLITIPTYKDWGWKDFNAIFESYKVISEGNEDATGKLKIELILTEKYGTSATQGEKPKFVLTISGLKTN